MFRLVRQLAEQAGIALYRHRLAADLPTAIERGEFLVYYQPLIRLADGVIIGFEALRH